MRTGWRKGRCRCRSTNTSDHRGAGGGSRNQLRRDLTIELVSQLNELDHDCEFMPKDKRLKLNEAPPVVARDVPVRNLLVG